MKNFLNKNKKITGKATYFDAAQTWADEQYHYYRLWSTRWQCAFWASIVAVVLLACAIMVMMPLKSWEPIVVQQNLQTGEIFVKPADVANLMKDKIEIESDLVRYVIARETYYPTDEGARYRQVQFMSSPAVFKPYQEAHRLNNNESFDNRFGESGSRIVAVEDVIFLDATDPRKVPSKRAASRGLQAPPIARIDFTTTENDGATVKKNYWVATVKFDYVGTPNTKEAAWANWGGFTVTSYRVDQRNVNV